ncbi:MAG: hypothetical protein EOO56_18180 [Hymenobacter sp.]|nr:MAG: hypothetical protein EOO56_18180 [Hymenobacter sp.]
MKTYTLEVLETANEDLVADILAALHKQRLIDYVESPQQNNPTLLSAAEIEQDILTARQQPGLSLSEACARFGV